MTIADEPPTGTVFIGSPPTAFGLEVGQEMSHGKGVCGKGASRIRDSKKGGSKACFRRAGVGGFSGELLTQRNLAKPRNSRPRFPGHYSPLTADSPTSLKRESPRLPV